MSLPAFRAKAYRRKQGRNWIHRADLYPVLCREIVESQQSIAVLLKTFFSEQVKFYLRCYRIIYRLEAHGRKSGQLEKNRRRMRRIFEKILATGSEDLKGISDKSELAKAIKYFQKNYDGLTLFLDDVRVPIDNNAQERLLRNPVIGRKTWYGTHPKRGAKTAATLFTIVESCELEPCTNKAA